MNEDRFTQKGNVIQREVYIPAQGNIGKKVCGFSVKGVSSDTKRMLKEESVLDRLLSYNDIMMNWLNDNDAHMQQFFENPVETFKQVTNAPDELLEACKNISEDDVKQYLPSQEHRTVAAPATQIAACSETNWVDYAQGWDFVSAITQSNANHVLDVFFSKKNIKFQKKMSFSVLGLITIDLEVKGTFGVPKIIGGSGSKVTMQIPIVEGMVNINKTIEKPLNGGLFRFTTNLKGIESTFTPKDKGKLYDFFINFTEKESISEVKLENFQGIEEASISNIEDALLSAMNKAFDGYEYKLFSVNLKGIDKKYPYMVPTFIKYAFIENGANHDANAIGVLVQTTGERSDIVQLHPKTIPSGCGASVVLSNRLAVDGLLRDMAKSTIGIADSNIKIEGKPLILSAKETFDYKEEIQGYMPEVKKFKLWFADDRLHMELHVHVTPSKGLNIDYYVSATFKHEIVSETDKNGNPIQTIRFVKDKYDEVKEVTAAWWVWLIGFLAAGIGAAIVAIILAAIDSLSPNLKDSILSDALVKVEWNHMELINIEYLDVSGHIQIGAYVKLLI